MKDFLSKLPPLIITISKAFLIAIKDQALELAKALKNILKIIGRFFLRSAKWLWSIYYQVETQILGVIVDLALTIIALRYLFFFIIIGIILAYFKMWLLVFIYVLIITIAAFRFFRIDNETAAKDEEHHRRSRDSLIFFMRWPLRALASIVLIYASWQFIGGHRSLTVLLSSLSFTEMVNVKESSNEDVRMANVANERVENFQVDRPQHPEKSLPSFSTESNIDTYQKASIPEHSVGTIYTMESLNFSNPKLSYNSERKIISVEQDRIILSIRNLKSNYIRTIEYDKQWNLISTRGAAGEGSDYWPPIKYFDFPLKPGKRWSGVSTERNIKTMETREHRISAEVGEWEKISVPAGTFQAIKVIIRSETKDFQTGEIKSGSDISWYAPSVRRSVKSELTTHNTIEGRDDKQSLNLLSYSIMQAPNNIAYDVSTSVNNEPATPQTQPIKTEMNSFQVTPEKNGPKLRSENKTAIAPPSRDW